MKEGAHAGLRLDLACEDPQFCEKQARQRAREAHKKAIATYARIRLLSMELRQQATEARVGGQRPRRACLLGSLRGNL